MSNPNPEGIAFVTFPGEDADQVTIGDNIPGWKEGTTTRAEASVDLVNHPPHYNQGGIECIDAIKAALTPEEFRGFCKGNAIKYIWREQGKDSLRSLGSAGWYTQCLIDFDLNQAVKDKDR